MSYKIVESKLRCFLIEIRRGNKIIQNKLSVVASRKNKYKRELYSPDAPSMLLVKPH